MKEAITSYGGVRVAAMDSIDETLEMTQKIPGISKLNNFAFETKTCTTVRTWQAYRIGKGKLITVDKPDKDAKFKWLSSTFTEGEFKSDCPEKSSKIKNIRPYKLRCFENIVFCFIRMGGSCEFVFAV
ncbi:hypothetical protein AC249_AIPGENE2578 [Exaiptasia diaphana]|nr:hypothetical protein AC249_AIPGENE2578 [Exaiptasia diaphana]